MNTSNGSSESINGHSGAIKTALGYLIPALLELTGNQVDFYFTVSICSEDNQMMVNKY